MRNTILELWKANKPCYASKTFVKQKMKKCGTAKEIGQVHSYLEQRGYINFGCGKLINDCWLCTILITKYVYFR